MKKELMVIGVVVLFLIVSLSGCFEPDDEESYSETLVLKQDETLAETGGNWVNFTVEHSKLKYWDDLIIDIVYDLENTTIINIRDNDSYLSNDPFHSLFPYYRYGIIEHPLYNLNLISNISSYLGDGKAGIITKKEGQISVGDKLIIHNNNLTVGYKYALRVILRPSSSFIFDMEFE